MNAVVSTVLLTPRNAAVLVLRGYRAAISPLYGDVCRYYPTCSAYALGAVQQYGVIVGSALATARIARCHPWAAPRFDEVPPKKNFRYSVTAHGFVVNPSHGKA